MDEITVFNLVPKFLSFYEKAKDPAIDEATRWSLWKEHYNFASVPPGEQGQQMARNLLANAWDKYHDHIAKIEQWSPKSTVESIHDYLNKIKSLVRYDGSVKLVIIFFVGGFENNAFVTAYDNERVALCLPVEDKGITDIILSHELTHIVHSYTANLSMNWERTIASTILQEGLATRVSKHLVPGYKDEDYIIEHRTGWYESCNQKRIDILKGIYSYLDDSTSESVTKFTFGPGTTNTEREAYYSGWKVVEYLLESGRTFTEIAHIQEKDMPNFIREIYPNLLEWMA